MVAALKIDIFGVKCRHKILVSHIDNNQAVLYSITHDLIENSKTKKGTFFFLERNQLRAESKVLKMDKTQCLINLVCQKILFVT